jgi:endonuclease/exonuclease/phosphatase family metal-dependent hydrolase
MRIAAGEDICSRLIVAVFVLALSGCTAMVSNSRDYSRQPLPPSAMELKVLTYNIRLAAGRYEFARDVYELPWGKSLPAVVAAIESADADVVALQEVAGPGQAKKLANALNMNFAYEGHQTGSARASWWGVAILSKFPILEARGTAISHGRGNTKHIVVARLDIGGKPCTFVSIHKDKDLYDGSSVRNILAAVADVQGPVVLAGDFNIQPGDARLEMLPPRFIDTATAVDTPGARRATSLGTGFGRIDYVFSESSSFEVIDVGLIANEHEAASDHFGYWARLAFR